jgi:hypothetical protein
MSASPVGVLSHAQSQMLVDSSRGKIVRESGVALGSLLFLIFHRLKASPPASVERIENLNVCGRLPLLVKQDSSRRIKLLQEIKVCKISGQHGASILPGTCK